MGTRSRRRRTKRHRHQDKQRLKFGVNAAPKHMKRSGRTGKITRGKYGEI